MGESHITNSALSGTIKNKSVALSEPQQGRKVAKPTAEQKQGQAPGGSASQNHDDEDEGIDEQNVYEEELAEEELYMQAS